MFAHCPQCGLDFDQPRHKKGAGYALDWTVLPDRNLSILKWWLGLADPSKAFSKEELKILYRYADMHGMAGRVSEFYALDLVKRVKEKGEVRYRLNRELAEKVVCRDGGKLK